MIKRQYFIHAEIDLPDGDVMESWRQCFYTSWFPHPDKVLELKLKEFTEINNVSEDKISIISFNRC